MATDNNQLIPGSDHSITVEKAKEMTKLFRESRDTILIPDLRGKDILSICETFNRESFDRILRQESCVALRIYFGMTPEKKVRVIAVGVDKDNKDLLPSTTTLASRTATTDPPPPPPPTEEGLPCPEFCPNPPL